MPADPLASQSVVENTEWIVFQRSPIHGRGGFARCRVPAGTRLIEYRGEVIGKDESLRRCAAGNGYIFALDDARDLDGDVPWNPARFLNHSCAPNCEAVFEAGRIWVIAARDLVAEEITFNYGYDLEEYRAHPCSCGAGECVGYMVAPEFFSHVRRQQRLALLASDPGDLPG